MFLPGLGRRNSAGLTTQNHYFVDLLRCGAGGLGKLAATAADYFLRRSPTQQNDRGFVALGWGNPGSWARFGYRMFDKSWAGKPSFFAEYQVYIPTTGRNGRPLNMRLFQLLWNSVDILGNDNREKSRVAQGLAGWGLRS